MRPMHHQREIQYLSISILICHKKGMKDDICVNKSAEIEIDTDVSSI